MSAMHEKRPAKCPDCGRRNSEPVYADHPLDVYGERFRHSNHGKAWQIACLDCGCFMVWSFPNEWKRTHKLPVMRDRSIVKGDWSRTIVNEMSAL